MRIQISIKTINFILFVVVVSMIMSVLGVRIVEGYTCKDGYTCSSDGGVVEGWYQYTQCDCTSSNQDACNCYTACKYGTRSYTCSGTSSSCSGGKTYFKTYSDCSSNVNSLFAGCCDKVSCTFKTCGCTATCSSGYTSDASKTTCDTYNSSTTVTKKCTSTDNCGKSCSDSETCYLLETNTTFQQDGGSTAGPTSVSITVDGIKYTLSTDPNNPTKIKRPAQSSTNVQVSVPTFTAPSTADGEQYDFVVDNYGVDNVWLGGTTCVGIAGEDFCATSTSNSVSFTPTSKTVTAVLTSTATGKISARYQTKDVCDSSAQSSAYITGYYVVDATPTIPSTSILPDVGTQATVRGCTSTEYTGIEANNPLHVVATATDTNSVDEIQAFILWFSKDTSIPSTTNITGTYDGGLSSDLGIMIMKNGVSWSNPLIYTTNTNSSWVQITDGNIRIGTNNIIKIQDLEVTQSSNILFDFSLQFLADINNLSGKYNLYAGAVDSIMVNSGLIDQSYLSNNVTWGIDMIVPTVNNVEETVKDATNVYLTWDSSDTTGGSGLLEIVLNGYRTGGVGDNSDLELWKPTDYLTSAGTITLTSVPSEDQIGLLTDFTTAWQFINESERDSYFDGSAKYIGVSNLESVTSVINIGENEGGKINMYVTAYDKACNVNGQSEDINLNSWFTTRGGIVYSKGNIDSAVHDVTSTTTLDDAFKNITKNQLDLGTELISTSGTGISELIHTKILSSQTNEEVEGAVKALGIYDSNSTKSYWFNTLLSKLKTQTSRLTLFNTISGNSVSDDCTGSYCYMNTDSDISIPSNYVCDKPTLFMTSGNINIEPNVTSSSDILSGCIFVAGEDIYIGAGSYKSTGTTIKYDYLEGFLIADNQVIFSLADKTEIIRDGIEILGSITAFGTDLSDSGNAISIQRNLRLFNQTNPTLVMTYDPKFSAISQIFFGTESPIYKQEVGFKNF